MWKDGNKCKRYGEDHQRIDKVRLQNDTKIDIKERKANPKDVFEHIFQF